MGESGFKHFLTACNRELSFRGYLIKINAVPDTMGQEACSSKEWIGGQAKELLKWRCSWYFCQP